MLKGGTDSQFWDLISRLVERLGPGPGRRPAGEAAQLQRRKQPVAVLHLEKEAAGAAEQQRKGQQT